jgi:gamma-tubulin complex component 2
MVGVLTDISLVGINSTNLPFCVRTMLVSQFVEFRSHFKNGLGNHALGAALGVQPLSVE